MGDIFALRGAVAMDGERRGRGGGSGRASQIWDDSRTSSILSHCDCVFYASWRSSQKYRHCGKHRRRYRKPIQFVMTGVTDLTSCYNPAEVSNDFPTLLLDEAHLDARLRRFSEYLRFSNRRRPARAPSGGP